jgi:transketolase
VDTVKVQQIAKTMRREILDISLACGKSVHMGGALSMIEILATLYSSVLKYDKNNPTWIDRDRFILSKGHGALGFYTALLVSGIISREVYETYQINESNLTTHPVMNLPLGIESSNGSLGQGLSMGVGLAIAAKRKGMRHKIYVMLGDGECNEGSVWEAVMSASNYDLDNLIAIVDFNGFQNDGSSEKVMKPGNLVRKWDSFGWNAIDVDGHDVSDIYHGFVEGDRSSQPKVLIAKTVKGKGFSFMEHNNDWHHNRLTKASYEKAILEWESEI